MLWDARHWGDASGLKIALDVSLQCWHQFGNSLIMQNHPGQIQPTQGCRAWQTAADASLNPKPKTPVRATMLSFPGVQTAEFRTLIGFLYTSAEISNCQGLSITWKLRTKSCLRESLLQDPGPGWVPSGGGKWQKNTESFLMIHLLFWSQIQGVLLFWVYWLHFRCLGWLTCFPAWEKSIFFFFQAAVLVNQTHEVRVGETLADGVW